MSLLNFARTCNQKGSEKCPINKEGISVGFLKSLLKFVLFLTFL